MVLSQESVLSALLSAGGRLRKSELVGKFRGAMDSVDPAEKERSKELFKTFVNNVAFVREVDGVRYVVVKKVYQRLLERGEAAATGEERPQQPPLTCGSPAPGPRTDASCAEAVDASPASEADPRQTRGSGDSPAELLTPLQLALQRSEHTDVRVKRMLAFEVQRGHAREGQSWPRGEATQAAAAAAIQSKPFSLPLRMPPGTTRVEIRKLKVDDPPDSPALDACRDKRRPSSAEDGTGEGGSISISIMGSPQLRRAVKSTKAPEEHRDTRVPSLVPLEQSEHEWLVKCAAGQWRQVYGLLLGDSQLADKRDFMSGFTALHWAAKCGNSDMLDKIVEVSRRGGVEVDVNAKTHGGYTPLHIAALHDQEYIMATLVGEHGADVSVRDNCGKRACHYLHKGVSKTVREMLGGGPGAQPTPPDSAAAAAAAAQEKEEPELFPDRSKGLHSISRLFQPHVPGHKKKHKQRPGFHSLSHDPEEREDVVYRQRVISEAFM
ncbi:ankyrin repeat domain-containing protein SOWAHA-like [Scophthalmus maximus]|uniref:ankyrin repeat domain-containing protein SOWAHA-like n=1 Tax=Scophthalmus maximus TaxID=52904 RepID=UPI001FA8A150|nr:ankyrin repeat domain-containing protein SOWAHA-like [Scophthalmus maximus]